MAVGTEHPKILQPVVVRDAVDMVDVHRERLPPPLAEPTLLATVFKESRMEQAFFDMGAAAGTHEELVNRHGRWA
jgi:hypothetical protein